MRTFLLALAAVRPRVRLDSGYAATIARGKAFGGLGWNGDGAYVIAHTPDHAADYVVAKEGGELWVDAHVIPKGAPNRGGRARVDRLRVQAEDQRDGDALHVLRLAGPALAAGADPRPTSPAQPRRLPARGTYRRLEPSALTPAGTLARNRIWAAFTK